MQSSSKGSQNDTECCIFFCKHTEVQITSIYFHFNQFFLRSLYFPSDLRPSLDFDTVIFYHTPATFNDLVSTLLQGQFAMRTFPPPLIY